MSQWSLQNAFPYKGELVHMSGSDKFGSPCTAFCDFMVLIRGICSIEKGYD